MTWPDWLDLKAAIAIVALVQPWLYWLYKKYGKGGHLDVHRTGQLEVGFSYFGPTLGLQGTLRAVDRDFFVSRMLLVLVRDADNARHEFEWGAFRPPQLLLGEPKDPVETPAGFMLQPLAPRRYNILFIDTQTRSSVLQLAERLSRGWAESVHTAAVPHDSIRQHYEQVFSRQPLHIDTFSALERLIYWEPGSYTVRLTIQCTRPNRTFTDVFKFSLTPEDVASLRLNKLTVLAAAVDQVPTGWRWNFASPRYE